MPADTHPMVLLSQAVLALQSGSKFANAYHAGVKKDAYWESTLEDSVDLTAKLPVIAAFIYRLKYFGETKKPKYSAHQDYGMNFARMMVWLTEKATLSWRDFTLYSIPTTSPERIRACHAPGWVCAFGRILFLFCRSQRAGRTFAWSCQSGVPGWLIDVRDKFGGVPSREDLYKFAWDTLNSGKVILVMDMLSACNRPTLYRTIGICQSTFPAGHFDQLAELVYDVVRWYSRTGQGKNPAPNVDAISGTLQYYYGVREFDFYTVLFGVGRALGVTPTWSGPVPLASRSSGPNLSRPPCWKKLHKPANRQQDRKIEMERGCLETSSGQPQN